MQLLSQYSTELLEIDNINNKRSIGVYEDLTAQHQKLNKINYNSESNLNYAQKSTHVCDENIQPLFFSELNIKYIQDRVKFYIKKLKNIEISDQSLNNDKNSLINLMRSNYIVSNESIKFNNLNIEDTISELNKSVIEKYVNDVLSGINMYNYYISDISNMPIPLSRAKTTSIKGVNVLSPQVGFEDNTDRNQIIGAFNTRYSY